MKEPPGDFVEFSLQAEESASQDLAEDFSHEQSWLHCFQSQFEAKLTDFWL